MIRLTPSSDADLHRQVVLNSEDDPMAPELKKMESGGMFRYYRLSIPDDYNGNSSKLWPLILDFHGRNGNAEEQWDNSQYYLNPSGQEFVVAYPVGCFGQPNEPGGPPERAWQGPWYADESCNDLLFVSDLVHLIQGTYKIDSTRIYASGKSNGGGFVGTLACSKEGDLFAAFAMASAALYTDMPESPDLCDGQRPRMILESHGTEDFVVPIDGRDSDKSDDSTPDIADWTARWAVRNGCDPSPKHYTETWGRITSYKCNGLSGVVQQYRVNGLGHCWPSLTDNTDSLKPDEPNKRPHDCIHTLDFTQAVVEFFARWKKST